MAMANATVKLKAGGLESSHLYNDQAYADNTLELDISALDPGTHEIEVTMIADATHTTNYIKEVVVELETGGGVSAV